MPHFVYIAECSDGSLYTGTCIDLKARAAKHNAGEGAKYTRSRLPICFIYHEALKTLSEARSREAAIKRLPREGKLQLIRGSVPLFPMAVKKSRAKAAKDITLKDVVVHMQHMEERLTSRIDGVEHRLSSRIDGVEQKLSQRIDQNTAAIQSLERRVDALDEDLTATIKDTYAIRKHVGLVSMDDE